MRTSQLIMLSGLRPLIDPRNASGTLLRWMLPDNRATTWTTTGKTVNNSSSGSAIQVLSGNYGLGADLINGATPPTIQYGYSGTSRDAVLFNGSTQWLRDTATAAFAQPSVIYIAYKTLVVTASACIFDRANGGTLTSRYYINAAARAINAGAALNLGSATTNIEVACLKFNGATSSGSINGSAVGTVGSAGTNVMLTGMTWGADRTAVPINFWNGAIFEQLVYSGISSHSAGEEARIIAYMKRGLGI